MQEVAAEASGSRRKEVCLAVGRQAEAKSEEELEAGAALVFAEAAAAAVAEVEELAVVAVENLRSDCV